VKRLLIGAFVIGVMLRLKFLGINGAGISFALQLLAVYFLEGWKSKRDWERDPNRTYIDENGVVRHEVSSPL